VADIPEIIHKGLELISILEEEQLCLGDRGENIS